MARKISQDVFVVLVLSLLVFILLAVLSRSRRETPPLSLVATPPGHMSSIVLLYNKQYIDSKGWKTVTAPEDVPDADSVLFVSRHDEHRHGPSLFTEHAIKSPLLERILNKCATFARRRFVIVCGKSDALPRARLLVPRNVARVYMNNVTPQGKMHFLPMGRDWRAFRDGLLPASQQTDMRAERSMLCFGAFKVSCYKDTKNCTRKKYEAAFKDQSWVTWKGGLARSKFFEHLSDSKFVLCPRGNALDTFRFYDTIYAGAIPIVEREAYHKVFDDIPILFVDTSNLASITEAFLQSEYARLIQKRRSYYRALDFDVWVDEINGALVSAQGLTPATWSPSETQVLKAARIVSDPGNFR
jgi:hypothetical protein